MKTIFVTFQKEGIHQYPGAPAGVEFLQYAHRHMFHIKVEIQVYHDDRELEFILVKRDLEKHFDGGALNNKSCEMICDDLYYYCWAKYCFAKPRNFYIEVSEDGENGARGYYEYENPFI